MFVEHAQRLYPCHYALVTRDQQQFSFKKTFGSKRLPFSVAPAVIGM
jgi:hypothetical protein